MDEEERDIVEFSDDTGNKLLLEVLDYFFYNGEEYAVLGDADETCDCEHEEETCDCGCDCEHEHDEACDCDCGCGHEHSLYIMKVISSTSEDGEEMEEFIPVEDSMMDQLIEVVQTRFTEDDDEDDEEDEEDETEEDEKKSDE
ncbi:MAG: DUF1292 domain-containing protein [Clostridia bacterium]